MFHQYPNVASVYTYDKAGHNHAVGCVQVERDKQWHAYDTNSHHCGVATTPEDAAQFLQDAPFWCFECQSKHSPSQEHPFPVMFDMNGHSLLLKG
jgi:hypothetical protein